MAFGDHERSNLRYQDSLTSAAPRYVFILIKIIKEPTQPKSYVNG